MKRRRFLFAGALGAFAPAWAFSQGRKVRIGMLTALAKSLHAPNVLRRLAELGYRDGADMALEYRHPDGVVERYPKLARELVDLKCDLIFVIGPELAARALRDASSSVPIVFFAVNYDPVERRIVASLRRPGANITGVYLPQLDLAVKRVEITQELAPGATRFLVLADVYSRDQLESVTKAAERQRVRLTVVEFARPPYDFAKAFETGREAGAQAVILLSSPLFAANRAAISALLASYRLPAVGTHFMLAEAGFLASYGPDVVKAARRTAEIGVRILKGAKPADIPVEQADEFELVVNLKTAKALGVKVPYSVLSRATRVIE